jgi:hypothetical protein
MGRMQNPFGTRQHPFKRFVIVSNGRYGQHSDDRAVRLDGGRVCHKTFLTLYGERSSVPQQNGALPQGFEEGLRRSLDRR